MQKFFRAVAGLTLLAFFGLSCGEAFHGHDRVQASTNCQLCKISHQSPALTHSAPDVVSTVFLIRDMSSAVVHPYLQFVFTSHGLSPPFLFR